MKTTFNISEKLMKELKHKTTCTEKTMSELVESALCESLAQREITSGKISLPTFHGGKPRVDISNRERLYDTMEDR